MAGVISISSDEEESNESIENPSKELKTESIICLDLEDDEEKDIKSNNEIGDIIIESDEDTHCSSKNVTTKVASTNDDFNGKDLTNEKHNGEKGKDLFHKNVKRKHMEDIITHANKKSAITKSVTKIIINNKDLEDIAEPDEGTGLITKSTPNITSDDVFKSGSSDDKLKKNYGASASNQDLGETFKTCEKMQLLISVCLSQITNEETKDLFKSKVPRCEKLFEKIDSEYIQSEIFNKFLEEKLTTSRESSLKAVSSFNDVYYHLKSVLHQQNSGTELTKKHQIIVAKLEHALRKVRKRIAELEEEEVDFDEEEDSSYIKLQRYRERGVNLHKKICKYKKEDANAHNTLYTRLDFSSSRYPEFNHAINKKFKNNSVFPSYYEVEQCLKKVNNDKDISLSDIKFKQEARECFKNLGNLLQKRRKLDLLNIHSHYLVTNDDPAYQNKELETKLKANMEEAKTKIEEICQKYVTIQESGANPELSSDSDDSKRASTEDENDDCK